MNIAKLPSVPRRIWLMGGTATEGGQEGTGKLRGWFLAYKVSITPQSHETTLSRFFWRLRVHSKVHN